MGLKTKLLIIILIVAAYFLGKANGDPNDTLRYGDTGLPRNCRAIIHENVMGYIRKEYTAEEIVDSIDRNCGATGYSWGL